MLTDVGITSAEELEDMGAELAMIQLLKNGKANHVMYYHALWLGLQGRIWNDSTPDEKVKLKQEFQILKQKAKDEFISENTTDLPPMIARTLREFGVI